MARVSVQAKFSASGAHSLQPISDVVNTVMTATVAADVATLVADGATPTQAHVNTLNTDWTALLAGLGSVPTNADVVLSFDTSKITTRSNLRQVVNALLQQMESGVAGLSP